MYFSHIKSYYVPTNHLVPSDLLKTENIIGEWSVEKRPKTSGIFTDSCKTDMKK